MIEPNELRIGNWVSGRNDPPMKVVSLSHADVELRFDGVDEDYGDWYYTVDELKPIPLTPEILESCGFELDETGIHYTLPFERAPGTGNQTFCCLKDVTLGYIAAMGIITYSVPTKYQVFPNINQLHKLQNLYFILIGEELQINLHVATN